MKSRPCQRIFSIVGMAKGHVAAWPVLPHTQPGRAEARSSGGGRRHAPFRGGGKWPWLVDSHSLRFFF